MNKINKIDIKNHQQEVKFKFKWKTISLIDFISKKSTSMVSFKVRGYAQIVFNIESDGSIKNQSDTSLENIIKKMEELLLKANNAELIVLKNKEVFGRLGDQISNQKIIQLGKKMIKEVYGYKVGILHENYIDSIDQVIFLCDIQAVSALRLQQIKSRYYKSK